MDTTPVHPRLWHRDFWLLSVANLLLTMSVYMLLPLLAQWFIADRGEDVYALMGVMGTYAVGLFLLGPFCNYLIQRNRRNRVYMAAAFTLVLAFLLLALDMHGFFGHHLPFSALLAVRVVQGAVFALAQMVLLSTLAVDVAESAQRTDANHALSWFSRLAMVLGPLAGFVLIHFVSVGVVLVICAAMAFVAMLMVMMATFPFKAPDDGYTLVSSDRFFLNNGRWLFLNNLLFAALVGVLLYAYAIPYCYLMLIVGFYVALRTASHFFDHPSSKWQIAVILVVAVAAVAFMLSPVMPIFYLSFLCWGFLIGMVNSQMSVMYIHVSRHCQRGTSQSTNFLSWEAGVALGVILAIWIDHTTECFATHFSYVIAIAVLLLFFFLFYLFLTLPWCLRHHQREKV